MRGGFLRGKSPEKERGEKMGKNMHTMFNRIGKGDVGMENDYEKEAESILLEDVMGDFWEKWENSDLLSRTTQVRKMINQNIRWLLLENAKFRSEREERLFLMSLSTLVNSYMEDLYAFMIKKFAETISSAGQIAMEEVQNENMENKGGDSEEKRENK